MNQQPFYRELIKLTFCIDFYFMNWFRKLKMFILIKNCTVFGIVIEDHMIYFTNSNNNVTKYNIMHLQDAMNK